MLRVLGTLALVAGAVTAAWPLVGGVVLPRLGFSAAGPVAGSFAAAWMSALGRSGVMTCEGSPAHAGQRARAQSCSRGRLRDWKRAGAGDKQQGLYDAHVCWMWAPVAPRSNSSSAAAAPPKTWGCEPNKYSTQIATNQVKPSQLHYTILFLPALPPMQAVLQGARSMPGCRPQHGPMAITQGIRVVMRTQP